MYDADEIRDALAYMDPKILLADGFDEALIGYATICHNIVALYDRAKCIEILMEDGMTYEDAEEHFQFNVEGSYVGEYTPAFATIMKEPIVSDC